MMGRTVFLTVGTTSFDELISCISSEQILSDQHSVRILMPCPKGGAKSLWALVQEFSLGPSSLPVLWSGKHIAFMLPEAKIETAILKDLGYNRLVLQIGRGAVEPQSHCTDSFTLDVFRYKDSLAEDIQNADLVISHAGAGSCLETLEAQKPLIVVINEKLMSNHQLELAKQLNEDGHLYYCTCSTLGSTLKTLDLSALKVFPPGHPATFAKFLDQVVGLR